MNKMRRLPGPAGCRLSEGDQTPEALYELFRDWQRTHTQSSVKALRSPRLQMDVWFCPAQEPMPRGTLLRVEHPELLICTLSRACLRHPRLHLTDDYMDVGNPEVRRLLFGLPDPGSNRRGGSADDIFPSKLNGHVALGQRQVYRDISLARRYAVWR